jgi:[ribosomal protein S5]-alanine N-acetyltransferase
VPGLPRPEEGLSDGVVTLRPWSSELLPALVERLNDPAIAHFTRVPSPYTHNHAEAYMAEMEDRRRAGEELALVTTDAATGEPLGTHNLRVTSWEHGRGELGATVFPQARGRSVSSRAGLLLARYAIERVGLARVEIYAATDNIAVQRACEKWNIHKREGILRSYIEQDGRRVDLIVYSALAEDLP